MWFNGGMETKTLNSQPTQGTVFAHGKHWVLSQPTTSGFRHVTLATTTAVTNRDDAVALAQAVIDGQVAVQANRVWS